MASGNRPPARAVKLLFIKLKHIGDALILTPTLAAARARYPDAEIWVVVRKGTEGILAGCSAIDQLRTARAPSEEHTAGVSTSSPLALLRELRRQRFDKVFELSDGDRGRWLALLSGARERFMDGGPAAIGAWWSWWFRLHRMDKPVRKQTHRVVKDFLVASEGLALGEPPPLQFDAARMLASPAVAATLGTAQPWVVLHPGTRWQRKRWPAEHWVTVGRALIAQGFRVVVSAGPDADEVESARTLVAALGERSLSTEGALGWSELAWLLYRARLFVGVDTAAMHLAAACQCPSVALFGPSIAAYWRPWQVPHRLVVPPPGSDASQTRAIDPAEVLAAVDELLAEAAPLRPA